MNWFIALAVFFIGVVLSFFTAAFVESGGFGAAVAVCYIGALILGRQFYDKEK